MLYKTGFGPRCEFLYNGNEKQLITLSAQLGYSKNKVFDEYKTDNALMNPNLHCSMTDQQKAVGNAIMAIGSIGGHLQIGDLKGGRDDGNFGVTWNDTSYKPKIFDFSPYLIRYICGLYHNQRPPKNEREGYIKQYAKDWKQDDTFKGYMQRKFTETLNDENFQKLLKEMPQETKEALDKYCKKIVGLDVVVKLDEHYNENSIIMTFDNIGSNEYGQTGAPLKKEVTNTKPSVLNFDNINENEMRQIGFASKKEVKAKSNLFGCFNSKKNSVDIGR